jgi:hypothetical protein
VTRDFDMVRVFDVAMDFDEESFLGVKTAGA